MKKQYPLPFKDGWYHLHQDPNIMHRGRTFDYSWVVFIQNGLPIALNGTTIDYSKKWIIEQPEVNFSERLHLPVMERHWGKSIWHIMVEAWGFIFLEEPLDESSIYELDL